MIKLRSAANAWAIYAISAVSRQSHSRAYIDRGDNLSEMKPFVADDFQIDLQLFGGGSGKKITKAVLTVGAFFFGAGGAGMAFFGTTSSIAGGMMGMSLFSAV